MARSKKEIDKELMYKKLMPTAQINAVGEEISNTPSVPLPITEDVPQVAEVEAAPANIVEPTAEPTAPTAETVAPPQPAAAEPLVPPVASAASQPVSSAAAAFVSGNVPAQEGELINVMETLVEQRIDAAIEKFRCCNCEKCRQDVSAITLNKLAPCYIVSTDNAKRIESEAKYAGQVATAIVQAILTVKARPTHN